MIARIVDGSKFDEFKAMYGDSLVTGKTELLGLMCPMVQQGQIMTMKTKIQCCAKQHTCTEGVQTSYANQNFAQNLTPNGFCWIVQ